MLRKEWRDFSANVNIADESRDAVEQFFLEKVRAAWINGKEFGWKKAWNWKGRAKPKETP